MPEYPARVYLDVCALSRPFDDQTQARIRLETEAVRLVISHIRNLHLEMIVSRAHWAEIAAIDEVEERTTLEQLLADLSAAFEFDRQLARARAQSLTLLKFGPGDAAHLAFAEQALADFVTVDNRLIRQGRRANLPIWIGSVLEYCEKEKLR